MLKIALWYLLTLLGFVAAAPAPLDTRVDYSGYKIFRVTAEGDAAGAEEKVSQFGLTQVISADQVDVIVPPDRLDSFHALSLDSAVTDEDLGASIAREAEFEPYAAPSLSWFNSYHAYTDHQQFIRDLQSALPSNSEVLSTGTSYQGRVMNGVHIWGSGGRGSKPAVLVHGTVHAREWIATMTAEYLMYELVTGYSSNATIKALVDEFDFYIFPIVNPDGFAYTQTNDRLWRKNRQPTSDASCPGRDNNRNWPYKWTVPGGSSTDPCDETYRGAAQNDAPENQGMTAFVNSLRDAKGIRLYLDIHSYGQYILTPYGYDCSARASNQAAQDSLASGAGTAVRQLYGTRYTTGPSCSTLYATSGSSTDYVGDVGGAPYTFTYELRDTGANGFVLPASQINPTVQETFRGFVYMFQRV